jgi:hypothetical protein
MAFREPTADEVRAEREKTGMGLIFCRRDLRRRAARQAIEEASSVDDLKDILKAMLSGPMF